MFVQEENRVQTETADLRNKYISHFVIYLLPVSNQKTFQLEHLIELSSHANIVATVSQFMNLCLLFNMSTMIVLW